MSTDRLDGTELEREFVTAVYMEPGLLDDLRMAPDEFSCAAAATVLGAQLALREAGEPIDPVAVREKIIADGGTPPDWQGGMGLWTPRASTRLHNMAELRRTRRALRHAVACCDSGNVDTTRAACTALGDARDVFGGESMVTLGDIAVKAAESALSEDESARINIGISGVHNALGGAGIGDMIVVGADTGVGKSSLALAMALGMERYHPVGIISCEDPEGIWGARGAAAMTGVSSLRMLSGSARKNIDDSERLTALIANPKSPAVILDFKIGQATTDVLTSMRRFARMGAKVIVVDYLQAILSETPQAPRKDQVRDIQVRLKGQAQTLGVTLVLLSQLSRPAKGNEKREPGKHDLKDCGDIENAAEIILLLWPSDDELLLNLKIEKSKWGATTRMHMLQRDKSGTLVEHEARYDEQPSNRGGF